MILINNVILKLILIFWNLKYVLDGLKLILWVVKIVFKSIKSNIK